MRHRADAGNRVQHYVKGRGGIVGSWDVGSFDNDMAVDWTYGLENAEDLSYVEAALDAVLEADDDELDAAKGECAIAAADVVARLLGNFGVENSYTETADTWVRAHHLRPPPELVKKARAALARTRRSPSELFELWEESGDLDGWNEALDEVDARLR